jgi:hypothetical protein
MKKKPAQPDIDREAEFNARQLELLFKVPGSKKRAARRGKREPGKATKAKTEGK